VLDPIAQMSQRVRGAREDSDVAYFFDLLYMGEMLLKITTVALVACIEDDRERHRYRLEHDLVRADSLGGWASALDDALKGPASQVLAAGARNIRRELTEEFKSDSPDWQAQAVVALHAAQRGVDNSVAPLPAKVALRRWFVDFVALRNRTRGHGATTAATCSECCEPLRESLERISENLTVLSVPWAGLRRNLSGKYRVTDLGNGVGPFEHLKTSRDVSLADGVYLDAGELRRVGLLAFDEDATDFFLPNGDYTDVSYETISYVTDSRSVADGRPYGSPPTALPPSETQGTGKLEPVGNSFSNLPPRGSTYINRDALETELAELLLDDRHAVITLVGRGGIGKTSLALETLYKIAEGDRFFAIVWFSARDIELLPQGPKLVQPHVLSTADMAREYVNLMQPGARSAKGFKALDYFAGALSDAGGEGTLFVFDNFETVRSPAALHNWLDNQVRLPNKILVTTRSRDFKGDYPVEVGGMTESEFAELGGATAAALGVERLVDAAYLDDLYRESGGHPYIAKVLLGEIARSGKKQRVERVMASQDNVLEALFERTFDELTPAAQRLFLTLSSWRSLISLVALEAAVSRPENERIEVEQAVEELSRSSLLDFTVNESRETYVSVPLSAALFGKGKLGTSAWKSAIEADMEVLQLFGAVQATGTRQGFRPQVERLFRNVADRLDKRSELLPRYLPILEFVARAEPVGWLMLGQMYEQGQLSEDWPTQAAAGYRRYLEAVPEDGNAWRDLARVCREQKDFLGAAHALVQQARLPKAPFADISYVANQLNSYMRDGILVLDTEEKRILLSSLIDVMATRRDEASGTDMSRLAWLLIGVQDFDRARAIVDEGLASDPDNPHLQKLAAKNLRESSTPASRRAAVS
jgi:hypothetical protein